MPTYTASSSFASTTSPATTVYGTASSDEETVTGVVPPWSDAYPSAITPPFYNQSFPADISPTGYSNTYTNGGSYSTGPYTQKETAVPAPKTVGPYSEFKSVTVPQQVIPAF